MAKVINILSIFKTYQRAVRVRIMCGSFYVKAAEFIKI